jgi:EAL domain-containing protein (putative c-di-GMP-specific phosphodiesterase class I)
MTDHQVWVEKIAKNVVQDISEGRYTVEYAKEVLTLAKAENIEVLAFCVDKGYSLEMFTEGWQKALKTVRR